MANVAVVGAQWGDEGKGKIVDWLSRARRRRRALPGRPQCRPHAGHRRRRPTSSRCCPRASCARASSASSATASCVDPWALLAEIEQAARAGRRGHAARTCASPRTRPLILPLHRELDRAARGGRAAPTRSAPPAAASARPTRTRSARRAIRVQRPRRRRRRSPAKLDAPARCTTTRCAAASAAGDRQRDARSPSSPRSRRRSCPSCRRRPGSCSTRAPRRQAHPVRGRAGRAARHRPRHLSRSSPRPTPSPAQAATGSGIGPRRDRLCARHRQGLHHARRRRARSRPSCTTTIGEQLGERGHEFGTVTGPQAPLRLVRRGAGAPDGQASAASTASRSPSSTCSTASTSSRSASATSSTARRIDHLPAGSRRAGARRAGLRDARRLAARSTRGARSWADLPAQAIKYVRRIEELIECAGGAALDQPRARRHDPGARSVRRLGAEGAGRMSGEFSGSRRSRVRAGSWRHIQDRQPDAGTGEPVSRPRGLGRRERCPRALVAKPS